MSMDHRAKLAAIKRFDQLIAYLRDEMGWPIARDSFEEVDDLFYDFTAEELGIDPKSAAKIQEIKRLRPLSAAQPWGIFFVKFEPKRLPVVALRRILSQVALKKRASANSAERAAWAAEDLLFVSNYGEGEERQITFAHFSTPRDGVDLPTLKVLGWNDQDTALHLDSVARELLEHLAWPKDDKDAEAWRRQWRSAFPMRHREVITTARDLSIRLADLAKAIRGRITAALAIETEGGPLTKLMKAFQVSLVHDLDADGFADMYAQTIAYGLLSARIADPQKKTADDFAGHMRTNPFLRELMETFLKVGGRKGKAGGPGIDFDELGVAEVVELLDTAKMEAVIRDFGDRNPEEDPVIHFYELFLKEYDAKKRLQRGVFYTPRPVVSYIVRSVDELLRTKFGLEDGLADTTTWVEMTRRHENLTIPDGVSPDQDFVQILDPATGTGTFLVEVIDLIHRTLVAKWKKQGKSDRDVEALWNEYVPAHLLTRLHGYELLMAPYAIAHLKIGLKLYETGYHFGSEERARIYLTNALDPTHDFSGTLEFAIPALAHEAQAVNNIKKKQRFTVVIGNPPYSGLSANLTESARSLVGRFKLIDGQKITERGALQFEKNLQDDYIKFIAFIEDRLLATDVGTSGIICNHGFVDNPTLRGLRWSLLRTYSDLWILDLHGNVNRGKEKLGSSDDQNVFDIKDAGVAILLCARLGSRNLNRFKVKRDDLWGNRKLTKYPFLLSKTVINGDWQEVGVLPDLFLFRAIKSAGGDEYSSWHKVTSIFPLHSIGIITARDSYVIDFEPEPVVKRAKSFRDSGLSDEETCRELGIPIKKGWNIKRARERIRQVKDIGSCVRPLLYRPFDQRPVFYHESLIWGMAWPVMQHMIDGGNIALITSRMTKGETFNHVLVSSGLSEVILLSSKTSNNAFVFPLYLRASGDSLRFAKQTNLSRGFFSALVEALKASNNAAKIEDLVQPRKVFDYIYAVLHSPSYRMRHAEMLAVDFPRIPLPSTPQLFDDLANLGDELVSLHLMESHSTEHSIAAYSGPHHPEVKRVGWSDDTVWLDQRHERAARRVPVGTIGFRGVSEAVWNFRVGGYQVCEKWLKDRKGRTLTKDDIAQYQKIVVTLSETIRLMKKVDEVIERHGGWPGAFAPASQVAAGAPESAGPDGFAANFATAVPHRAPVPPCVATEPVTTLLEAAEPVAAGYKPQPSAVDEIDREELICQVRQVFSSGGGRTREAAIRELATQLGYERVGPRIREELDNAIRTAVRRGILLGQGDELRTHSRTIEDYERDFLKEQFLASLQGRAWTDREEAIKGFARWLGFRRTGPSIDEMGRSLINGLIRDGRLEKDGPSIRRIG